MLHFYALVIILQIYNKNFNHQSFAPKISQTRLRYPLFPALQTLLFYISSTRLTYGFGYLANKKTPYHGYGKELQTWSRWDWLRLSPTLPRADHQKEKSRED